MRDVSECDHPAWEPLGPWAKREDSGGEFLYRPVKCVECGWETIDGKPIAEVPKVDRPAGVKAKRGR